MEPHRPWVVRGVRRERCAGPSLRRLPSCGELRRRGDTWKSRLAPRAGVNGVAGRSLGAICAQIKDPARNGGEGHDCAAPPRCEDSLVGWAWKPGGERTPAPGTQAAFGALMRAWAESGAGCPPDKPE